MIVIKRTKKGGRELIVYQNPSHHFAKNAVFSIERCDRTSPLHWHGAIEFVFILHGKLDMTLNNNRFIASRGPLIAINSSAVHSFTPIGEDVDYYFLVANDDFFKTNNLYSQGTHFDTIIESEEAIELFKKITAEYERADEYSNTAILSHLMSLFIYLGRNHATKSEDTPPSEEKKLKMVRGALVYLQEHYKEKITIEDLAEKLHYSKSYLSHTFKEITHYSLISYINLLRCQNATSLLLDGVSVSEAATESGFSEISYFTRVFKKTLGILPSQVEKNVFTLNGKK